MICVSHRTGVVERSYSQAIVSCDLLEAQAVGDVGGHGGLTKTCACDCSGTIVRITARFAAVALDDGLAEDSGDVQEDECNLHVDG